MNALRLAGAVCLGVVAVTATACEKSVVQQNTVVSGPEQTEDAVVQPIDDSKTLPMPMPSVDMPPVTEKQKARTKPEGQPGVESGNQGGS